MNALEQDVYLHILLNLFRGLYKSIDDDWRTVASTCGLTTAQQHLLWILYFKNGSTLTEISNLGQWHVSTVMNMVERMEKKAMLYKVVDKNDARVKRVYLTPLGQSTRQESARLNSHFRLHRLLKGMDKEELQNNIKILQNLVKVLAGEDFTDYVDQSARVILEEPAY